MAELEQQRIEYEAQGFLCLEGALEPEELAQARLAFDRAEKERTLDDLPNQDSIFIRLAEQKTIFPIVHRIIGDVVQLSTLSATTFGPDDAGDGWCKDLAGMLGVDHSRSTMQVDVVIYLDDVSASGSCVSAVPGSHRFRADAAPQEMTQIEEMPHQVLLRAPAGSAIVYHGNIWKARTRNDSAGPVRVLVYSYNHCWMRQDFPELSSIALDSIRPSHNLSQLFGIGPDVKVAAGYWDRSIEGYPSSTGLPERRFSELKVVGKAVTPNKLRSKT
jgi:hypothetical protein